MSREVFQIAFPNTKIDEQATFERVEHALETASIYKRLGFVRKEIRNTPVYEYRASGHTNEISKPVENAAVFNVDGADWLKRTHDRVMDAVERLKSPHQSIIRTRFLEEPQPVDQNVWEELQLSERTYYRIKREAMSELAYMLRLEVIKTD